MSRHSKWHSLKHKKGSIDVRRSKIFTRHGQLIALAARQGGGDPSMNPGLRLAIDNAKKDNFPNTNIERAIQRGSGAAKGEADFAEMVYEGYGPAGVAVIVECLTDNKNRTYTNVRTVFGKKGGNLGNSGSVGWMFEKKGEIRALAQGKAETVELWAIDAGADEVESQGDEVEIGTPFALLHQVVESLKAKGVEVERAEIVRKAKEPVHLENPSDIQAVADFLEALEDDPDVTNVYSNALFPAND